MEIEKVSETNRKKPGGKKQGKRSRKQERPNHEPDHLQSQNPDQWHSQPPQQLQSEGPEEKHTPDQLQSLQPEPPHHLKPEPPQSQNLDQVHSREPEQQHDSKKEVEAAVTSANIPPVDFQTIAMAYGDYTKKSFALTKAYVEKLSGVRSLDKIVEIQTEFAKQAYDTFVTESKKIRELYSGLAKQNLKPFEGFVTRKNPAAH